MARAKITLRNFRSFDWKNPIELEFGDGFTALVGPNNSGKSSILKSIYELRHLFVALTNYIHSSTSTPFTQFDVNFLGISDPTELANNIDPKKFHIKIESTNDTPETKVVTSLEFDIDVTNQTCKLLNAELLNLDNGVINLTKNNSPHRHNIHNLSILYDTTTYSLAPILSICKNLSNSIYLPAFRNAINEGAAQYYDCPVGTSLVGIWDLWKAGDNKKNQMAISKVEEDIAELLGFNSLEINADNTNKTLHIVINKKPYKLYEVGAGIAQLIITLATALVKKPPYIFIDEPELNLHPALQLRFLLSLASYADQGLVFATHSIGLARSTAERIYSVAKTKNQSSHMAIYGGNQKQINFSEWLGELSYSSRMELGCERILLVEGPSEVLLFQEFLRKSNIDNKYVIIQLGGSSIINNNSEIPLSELTRITDGKNIYAFIDSEKKSENDDLDYSRKGFDESCKKLGINITISQRRAIENYFPQRAITKALGDQYKELAPHEKLGDTKPCWRKSENWKIVIEMSMDDLIDTDLGTFLTSLESINSKPVTN